MRAVFHLVGVVVLLPYLALASAFLILGHAIASGSLLGILDRLLNHALWIVPWGIIGAAVVIVAVALLGVIPGTRLIGAACLGALAAASLVVILVIGSSPIDVGQALFLVPCAAVLVFAAWSWSTIGTRY